MSRPAGQHRWVEYADIHNYDAAMISPDWHGWIHYMHDKKTFAVYHNASLNPEQQEIQAQK